MPPPPRPKLAVLISAGGTTMQNLIDRIADGRLSAAIVSVISSRADVLGVERARRAGLPVTVIERKPTAGFSDRVFAAVRAADPDLVILAGWLHLLSVPADFRHRVLNIHPSLLPAFGGKGMYGHRVHQAVLDSGAKVTGCTVHFADDSYDTGPIVVQKAVPVRDDDTAETLAARVYEAECEAYPEAIRRVAAGGWKVEGPGVVWAKESG